MPHSVCALASLSDLGVQRDATDPARYRRTISCRSPRVARDWMMLKWLIAAVVVLHGGFVVLLYVAQRLQYLPERRRTAPRGGWPARG